MLILLHVIRGACQSVPDLTLLFFQTKKRRLYYQTTFQVQPQFFRLRVWSIHACFWDLLLAFLQLHCIRIFYVVLCKFDWHWHISFVRSQSRTLWQCSRIFPFFGGVSWHSIWFCLISSSFYQIFSLFVRFFCFTHTIYSFCCTNYYVKNKT